MDRGLRSPWLLVVESGDGVSRGIRSSSTPFTTKCDCVVLPILDYRNVLTYLDGARLSLTGEERNVNCGNHGDYRHRRCYKGVIYFFGVAVIIVER